jgi:DNA-binding IclR family transcriptional regulator
LKPRANPTWGSGGVVQSVAKALALLGAIDLRGQSLTELSTASRIPMPTALRLLRSLEAAGYVQRGPEGKYFPGEATVRLAHAVDPLGAIRWRIRDAVGRLCQQLKETITFQVREGEFRVCLAVAEGSQTVRHIRVPGEREILYRGATGKVLLAFGPSTDLDVLVTMTNGNFKSREDRLAYLSFLANRLVKVRKQGFAISKGSPPYDLAGVSVPIYFGKVFVGALSIGFPTARFNKDVAKRFTQACLGEAELIKSATTC